MGQFFLAIHRHCRICSIKKWEIAGVKYAEAFLRIPIKSKSELVKEYDELRRKNKGKSYYDS